MAWRLPPEMGGILRRLAWQLTMRPPNAVTSATGGGARQGTRREREEKATPCPYLTIRYPASGTVATHVSDSFVVPSMSHTQTSPSVAWCHRMSAIPSPL